MGISFVLPAVGGCRNEGPQLPVAVWGGSLSLLFGVGYTLVGKQLERVEYVFPVEASTYEIRICERPEVKKRSILAVPYW